YVHCKVKQHLSKKSVVKLVLQTILVGVWDAAKAVFFFNLLKKYLIVNAVVKWNDFVYLT
ncbi:hypothetical protein ACJBVZ_11035, partial [Streptococcus suis]